MIYLVLKDLLLQKRMFSMMFLYVLLFSFSFQSMVEGQLIATLVAVGYMFVMMGCAWEDKNKADVLWNSLPVPRWKIVGSKYLSAVIYVLMVVPVYWLVAEAFALLGLSISTVPVTWWSIVSAILTVLLISCLYLPIFFALGYTKSRYWNFVLFAGTFTLSSIVPQVFPEAPAWLQSLETVSGETLLIYFSIVVFLIVAISFSISLILYSRREF